MKIGIKDIVSKKGKEKITMITAYTYTEALLINQTDIDIVLIGDSAGMVVYGYESTLPVTMDEMLPIVKGVSRGIEKALIVADMPFGSYQSSIKDAIENAIRFVKAGANAIKLEGGIEYVESIYSIIRSGIPVMGHIGLMPQSINIYGGYKVQGRDKEAREKILEDAKALEEAGVFSIVLEGIPEDLAKEITNSVSIPTIGIGAGRYCDGQVLVYYDLLGYYDKYPKFVRKYENMKERITKAISNFIEDVKKGNYPSESEIYK